MYDVCLVLQDTNNFFSYTLGMEKTLVRPKTVFAPGIELTPKQRQFVTLLVRNGTNPTQAAREAGYATPGVSSYDLMRLPHITAAIRHERQRYITGELASIATGTLRTILTDSEAPAAARVQAARTVLEMSGEIGRKKQDGDEDKPLSELSADELSRLIDRWTEERAALAKPVDAEVVDVIARADLAQPKAQT
jgi:hypothetical protein